QQKHSRLGSSLMSKKTPVQSAITRLKALCNVAGATKLSVGFAPGLWAQRDLQVVKRSNILGVKILCVEEYKNQLSNSPFPETIAHGGKDELVCRKAAFYSCSGARRSETSHRHLWQQGKSSQTTPILCFSNALVLYQLKLSNFLLTCRISSTVAAFSRPGPFQLATTAMTLILVSSSILFRHNGVEQIRDTMSVAVNEVKPIFQNAADHPIFRNRHLHLPTTPSAD
ncbi:hypothetical protein GN958_ATG00948, partial [Phytophthora infestans]